MKKEGCVFCQPELSFFPHFELHGVSHIDRVIIHESDNFLVKPDVLPGNPDGIHMLLIPKVHTLNFAGQNEFTDEIGRIMYTLEQHFGPLVVFEHGGLQEGSNHQSVYHAHAHLYGGLDGFDIISYMSDMLNGKLPPDYRNYPHQIVPATNYAFVTDAWRYFQRQPVPYLFIQQRPWGIFVSDPENNMASQITQRAMHLFFSGEIFDWKQLESHPDWQKLSIVRILSLLEKCKHIKR